MVGFVRIDFHPDSISEPRRNEVRQRIRSLLLERFNETKSRIFVDEAIEASCDYDSTDSERSQYARIFDKRCNVNFGELDGSSLGNLLSLFSVGMSDIVNYDSLSDSGYKSAWRKAARESILPLAATGITSSNQRPAFEPQLRVFINRRILDLVTS